MIFNFHVRIPEELNDHVYAQLGDGGVRCQIQVGAHCDQRCILWREIRQLIHHFVVIKENVKISHLVLVELKDSVLMKFDDRRARSIIGCDVVE